MKKSTKLLLRLILYGSLVAVMVPVVRVGWEVHLRHSNPFCVLPEPDHYPQALNDSNVFEVFQVMSNELNTPKVVVVPVNDHPDDAQVLQVFQVMSNELNRPDVRALKPQTNK